MSDNKKIYTWRQWVIIIPAGLLGIALFLYRRYTANGFIGRIDWLVAGFVLAMLIAIIGTLSWWGNKPGE